MAPSTPLLPSTGPPLGYSPLLRSRSLNWIDMVTDGAINLIDDHGLSGFTVRALADWLGVTPSAVSHRSSRDRLVVGVVHELSHRWLEWIESRTHEHGVLALLATDNEGVTGVRVWLAIVELGRSDERTGRRVAEVRARERALVSRLTRASSDDANGDDANEDDANGDELDRLMALVDGLRMAVCAPVDPMPVERALALLAGDPSSRAASRAGQ